MPDRRVRAERGFTLLEILVGLVVLGFITVMLTQGVQFGLQAWRSQAQITRRGDLDAADRTLRTLVARMDPGTQASGTLVRGNARSVSFTTDLPLAAAQLATRQADVSVSVDAAHRLSLFWLTHFRTWLGPERVPVQATLADGIEHVEISYWQRPTAGRPGAPAKPGGWITEWDGRAGPPALVRFRLAFVDRRRHWPDIVSAPMRERLRP